ncbi:DUF1351 domain-containing protein [Oceanobacillus kimchii]|uniref:DUF1351 domain-containing protein n=1 Tax=Oceanobacillus kimchii TaxID=746691 RepID=UPI0021A548DA|nr:DUF1351 domain-containing protein [Oceanobacillus kimchii]MCT1575663.1 DUF1351 domain-containing protein [Oceanobacillus kimchii]MCT2137294.1 DUF1351 domain-containing protein [Oceanobacillus kimchii]
MNELQVKTIDFQPAKVEFNYKELETVLDESLKKYNGLTFTEDDAAECKATITELNKGKKALDAYRKDTKKELTASVTQFENQCKTLNQKFDEVIEPLKDQYNHFEENRKEEKRKQVVDVIKSIVVEFKLNEKYANELVVDKSYLNKSKSMKAIKEELANTAEHLFIKQQKEESDTQTINSTVELANERYNLSLSPAAYIRLLDYKEVQLIKTQILDDAMEEAEKQIKEQEKQSFENAIPEQEDIEKMDIPFEDVPNDDEQTDPFMNEDAYISDPFITKHEPISKSYKITADDDQLKELEHYLTQKGIKWAVMLNVQ